MRILVITHYYAQGPAQELVKFLRRKKIPVDLISHPFPYCKDTRSWMEFTTAQGQSTSKYFWKWRGPAVGFYVKDFLLTLLWSKQSKIPYDLVISYDCLNTAAALVLRQLGQVRTVVYGCIDYAIRRFESSILNHIYFTADKAAATYSDMVWNLSPKMHERRLEIFGQQHPLAPALVVPTGGDFEHIQRIPEDQVNSFRLVYMGHLRPYQGIELAIDTVAHLVGEFPELTLDVVGGGPLLSDLQSRVQKLNLSDRIRFHGFIQSHEEVEMKLTHMGIGLALYQPDPKSFTYFTDTNKPQIYMACGLPVLITDVASSSGEICRQGAGLLVTYDVASVSRALRLWLTNSQAHIQARRKAIQLAEGHSWNVLFDTAFEQTLQQIKLDLNLPGSKVRSSAIYPISR